MRIVVLVAGPGQKRVRIHQCTDDSLVSVAELALIVDDALAFEARRVLGEEPGLIDRERNGLVDAPVAQKCLVLGPDLEVVGAVTGRGMNEARTGVLGDVIARKKRHLEAIGFAVAQRMGEGRPFECTPGNVTHPSPFVDPRRTSDRLGKCVRHDELFSGLGPIVLGRLRDLVEAVTDVFGKRHGSVSGNCPRRGCPDHNGCADEHFGHSGRLLMTQIGNRTEIADVDRWPRII